jgi:hypothetical protein
MAYHSFSGEVEASNTPHDTPPYPFMPSPTSALSSVTCPFYSSQSNRREECVQMPEKMAISDPRPPFGLRGVTVVVCDTRLPCQNAGKAEISTPDRELSGESRFNPLHPCFPAETPTLFLEETHFAHRNL